MDGDVFRPHAQRDLLAGDGAFAAGGLHAQRRAAFAERISTLAEFAAAAEQNALHQIGDADEIGDEGIGRPRIDRLRIADLLDHAVVHHHHAVAHHQRLGLVVRDIDRGDADLLLQPHQLDPHLLAQLGVEIGQRLVEQDDARLVDDGARERDALALAAGQLGGVAVGEMRQADQFERLAWCVP